LQNIGRYDCDCYCYYYYYYYYYYYIYIHYYIYTYYYIYYYYYCYYYYYYYSEDSEVPGGSNNRVISRKFSMGKTSFTTRTQQHGTHEKATVSHVGNQRTESESPTWHRHGTGVSHDNTESLTLHRQGMT
jgi:hypothetical protein